MNFKLKFLLMLAVTYSALGTEYLLIQMKEKKNLAAIKYSGTDTRLEKGLLLVTSGKGKSCSLKVTKINKNKKIIFVTTKDCEHRELLKKGSTLTESTSNSYGNESVKGAVTTSGLPSKNESWYTYWGAGFASVAYDDPDTQALVDSWSASAQIDHISISMDLFGFYWPVFDQRTMVGFIVNAVNDYYKFNETDVEVSIKQYTYSASMMKFFGQNIGHGWFMRGDIGIAKNNVKITGVGTTVNLGSQSGFGALLGGGYAFPMSDGTRLLLNMNYAYRSTDSIKISTTAFTLGLLF